MGHYKVEVSKLEAISVSKMVANLLSSVDIWMFF